MQTKHTIFYSWQSDLSRDTNQNAIRQSLREAANLVEDEFTETRVELDEATRNALGSPNILKTIFDKIDVCDIFVSDITTINKTTNDSRHMPNPNVLVELGYAIATVGWERIVLLFNVTHGSFPGDLPFDIDKHRVTKYKISDKKDVNGKRQLTAFLKTAVKLIIENSPLKPDEKKKLTPEQQKREMDVKNLRHALNAIHLPTFDHFFEEFPRRVPKKIFHFKEYFASVLESSSFFIYDEELYKKLMSLKEKWDRALSYGQHYDPDGTGSYYSYYIPMDQFQSPEAKKDFNYLTNLNTKIHDCLKDLIRYVRLNYLEIDIEETSKSAFENYTSEMEK